MDTDTAQLLGGFLPLVIIFAVFWFFVIRPQQKQQKEHKAMLDNLKVGDRVITIGGIKGKIVKIKDDNIRLRVSANVDIDVIKNSIGRLESPASDDEGGKDK